MPKTPFIYLRDNIDKIRFICDEPAKSSYKGSVKAMLTKLDQYFVDNKLYSCNNYQKVVEDMISGKSPFMFTVDEKMRDDWGAYCTRGHDGKGDLIAIKPGSLGKGETTEALLCHEFFHHLTTGQEKIEYKKDGSRYRLWLQDGRRVVFLDQNDVKGETQYTGNILSRTFINEGLTELSKQQVYGNDKTTYIAQTKMVKFLNALTGEKENMADYLRGNLPNYEKYIGFSNLHKFYGECDAFQEEFNEEETHDTISYKRSEHFIKAQNYLVEGILSSLKDKANKIKPKDVVRIVKTIMQDAPISQNYKAQCEEAIGLYSFAAPLTKVGEHEQYEKILKDAINTSMLGEGWDLPPTDKTTRLSEILSFFSSDGKVCVDIRGVGKRFVDDMGPGVSFQNHSAGIWVSFNIKEDGGYTVSLIDFKTREAKESFDMVIDPKNAGKMVVTIPGEAKHNVDFAKLVTNRQNQIQMDLDMLDNFELFRVVGEIAGGAGSKVGEVRTIKNQKGEEYLVARVGGGTQFYKVDGEKCEPVKIAEKFSPKVNTPICQEIYLSDPKDKKHALKGYNPTSQKTEEDSAIYLLEDGTQFVSYTQWDDKGQSGRLAYGEQLRPYASSENSYIVETESTVLFDRRNKAMATIFSTEFGLDKAKEL